MSATVGIETELFSLSGADGLLKTVSSVFGDTLGREPDALQGMSILELLHPQDALDVATMLTTGGARVTEVVMGSRFRHADGTFSYIRWVARPYAAPDGWLGLRCGSSAHLGAAEDLGDLTVQFDLAVAPELVGRWHLDVASGSMSWNARSPSSGPVLRGSRLPSSVGELRHFLGSDNDAAFHEFWVALDATGQAATRLQVVGELGPWHLDLRAQVVMRDRHGRAARAVGLLIDVTTQRAMEDQVLKLTMTDPLTGVPNRRAFDQALRSQCRDRAAGRSDTPLSVLILDIDDFKLFNGAFGFMVGDGALTSVARALQGVLGLADTEVARLTSGQFAAVLPGLTPSRALHLAHDLCAAVRSVRVRQAPLWELTASVGTATWSPGEVAPRAAQLSMRADDALYAAKEGGKDRALSFEGTLAARKALEESIETGIDRGEFFLHFQPIVEVGSGRIAAYEGLMRWNRPGHGVVSPDSFIPVAERSALICGLGRVALRLATQKLAAWLDQGLHDVPEVCADVRVAVNLSGRHLVEAGVVDDVAEALAASGLAPERLEIELTETAVVESDQLKANLAMLRARGVRVSIDDFGTGHTSIGQLADLAVDTLKIDQSFIRDRDGRRRLVELVVAAAHLFELTVVAEGVEDPATMGWLNELGCDLAQGFGLARPGLGHQVLSV